MTIAKFFLYIFLSVFSFFSFGEESVKLPVPSKNECSFYIALEDVLKCQKESPYLVEYGRPYCLKFQEMEKSWNGKLKKWVPDTTYCLQAELARDRSNLSPCKLMEDTAFGSHPTCYMKSGFCAFNYFDKQRVMNVVAWIDVISTFSQSTAQILRVKSTCDLSLLEGYFHILDYLFRITRTLDSVSRKLAGEIFLNTPSNDVAINNRYYTEIYYILQTGDQSLDRTTVSSYAQMGASESPQTMEASFEKCKSNFSLNEFCQKLKASNPNAYKKADSGADFVLAIAAKDIKVRIKMANDASKKKKKKR
jgi:hypothetical protein